MTILQVYTDWGIPPERERPDLVACADDVRAALGKQEQKRGQDAAVQLLDARAAAQFTGTSTVVRVTGPSSFEALWCCLLSLHTSWILFLELSVRSVLLPALSLGCVLAPRQFRSLCGPIGYLLRVHVCGA